MTKKRRERRSERPKRDHLKHVHDALTWWAEWTLRHLESSAIGFPSETAESRLRETGVRHAAPAHSISPEVMMPRGVATVDRAIRDMPAHLAQVVRERYVCGREVAHRKLDQALHWIAGRMASEYRQDT